MKEYHIPFNDLDISRNEIGDQIGYDLHEIPEYFLENIDAILSKYEKNTQLVGGFIIFEKIQINKKDISINGNEFRTSAIIAKAIKKADLMAVFACSAGQYTDDLIHQFKVSGDMLNSYLADIIASLIAEKCAEYICNEIQQLVAEKSMFVTNRYSPGYCNWDVSEQLKLFRLLPENFCGISLNDNAMMVPIKSVSGVLGIGKFVKKEEYQCSTCERTDCLLNQS